MKRGQEANKTMKKIIVTVFILLMLFSLTACQSGGNHAEIETAELQTRVMQQLDEANKEKQEPSVPAETQTAVPENTLPGPYEDESGDLVLALNATIDGETTLITDGMVNLTATAVIPEGMAVDYWELNGERYYEDMEDTFHFSAQGNTVVDARLRPEHKVTAINAEMQFLDTNGKPMGEEFTEFVFEEDYENPVTNETLPGGWITVCVKAVVPKGYAVDYWLIDDVPYYYNRTVTSFTVYDLNETTVYEAVLKKENITTSKPTPRPTPAPTPKPTSKPAPAPTPKPTRQPVTVAAPTQAPQAPANARSTLDPRPRRL